MVTILVKGLNNLFFRFNIYVAIQVLSEEQSSGSASSLRNSSIDHIQVQNCQGILVMNRIQGMVLVVLAVQGIENHIMYVLQIPQQTMMERNDSRFMEVVPLSRRRANLEANRFMSTLIMFFVKNIIRHPC